MNERFNEGLIEQFKNFISHFLIKKSLCDMLFSVAHLTVILLFFFWTNVAMSTGWVVTSAPFEDWSSLVSSSNGVKLFAVAGDCGSLGQSFSSMDSGVTWNAISNTNSFSIIICSADGTKLLAAGSDCNNTHVYTSGDSGATWQTNNIGLVFAYAAACSADGNKIILTAGYRTYLSTNFGATWYTNTQFAGQCVASSADGNKLYLSAFKQPLFISNDSGATWTTNQTMVGLVSIATSADGKRLIGADNNGNIYSSFDSGATWRTNSGITGSTVACSANASTLVAGYRYGGSYVSFDGGAGWGYYSRTNIIQFTPVAMSADGTQLIAASDGDLPNGTIGGYIYKFDHTGDLLGPIVTNFSPSALAVGGTTFITGTNFISPLQVSIGGISAHGAFNSTLIEAIVPNGAVTAPIVITTPDGIFTTTSNLVILPTISPPTLTISRSQTPASVIVTWPVSSNSFALQINTNLSLTNGWQTPTTAPFITNGLNVYSNQNSLPLEFFRLKSQ